MRGPAGQVALAAGVMALAAAILWGAMELPTSGGYAQVGPGVVPRIVGACLLILGVFLMREAFAGGFRGVDEEEEARIPIHWASFGWVTAGILGYGLLIEHAGFILSSTLLFVLVARGFGSGRWLLNAITGAVL